MKQQGGRPPTPNLLTAMAIVAAVTVANCTKDDATALPDSPFPPGVDHRKEAVSGVEVGQRLMAAGEYELALDSFTRAALDEGMTPEILTGIGTANLGLGRLGQAEPGGNRARGAKAHGHGKGQRREMGGELAQQNLAATRGIGQEQRQAAPVHVARDGVKRNHQRQQRREIDAERRHRGDRDGQHQIDHLNGRMYFDNLSKVKRDMLLRKARKMGD